MPSPQFFIVKSVRTNVNSAQLLEIVGRLDSVISEHADDGERIARVPDATAAAFREAGLFNMWLPKSLGGWEVDPISGCKAIEHIAAIDVAAAWMLQMCSAVSMLCAWMSDEAIAEIHAIPTPVFGDSFAPPMRLTSVDGGWRVTGQAQFISNCHHIDWFFGLGMKFDGDTPIVEDDGHPKTMTFAVPKQDFEIVDNWNTAGMRGTGSHDVRVDNLFIPSVRVAEFHPIEHPRNDSYQIDLAKFGTIWMGIASMGAVGLGVGQGLYNLFTDLCANKTANYTDVKVGETPLTHYRLGEAYTQLSAARHYYYATLERIWESIKAGNDLTTRDRCDICASATFAVHNTARMLDIISESAGTSMVREEHPLARKARDLRTLTQHVFTAKNRYQDIGAMLLGSAPGFDMLAF